MSEPRLQDLDLTEPAWLAARIDDTGRRWDCGDARVNATLWWYSASSVIVFPLLSGVLVDGAATRPDPARGWLRETGYLGGLGALDGRPVLARELPHLIGSLCAPIVAGLASAAGVRTGPLWAILGDSITGRALDSARGRGPHDPARVVDPSVDAAESMRTAGSLADRVIAGMRLLGHRVPRPRMVDVSAAAVEDASPATTPRAGTVRACRRSSCCLIHLTTPTPNEPPAMCASCPRLSAARREERMTLALWR